MAASTAPPSRCTRNEMALATAESRKNGAFSRTNADHFFPRQRLSGQKSSNSSANGSVTTIGLAISPPVNATRARVKKIGIESGTKLSPERNWCTPRATVARTTCSRHSFVRPPRRRIRRAADACRRTPPPENFAPLRPSGRATQRKRAAYLRRAAKYSSSDVPPDSS